MTSKSDRKKIRIRLVQMLTDPNKSKTGEPLTVEEANWLIDSFREFSQQELADLIGNGNLRAAEVFSKLCSEIVPEPMSEFEKIMLDEFENGVIGKLLAGLQ